MSGSMMQGKKKPKEKKKPLVDYEGIFQDVGGLEGAKGLGFDPSKATLQSPDIFGVRRREEAEGFVEDYLSPEKKSQRVRDAQSKMYGEVRGEAEVDESISTEGLGVGGAGGAEEGATGSKRKKKKLGTESGLGIG